MNSAGLARFIDYLGSREDDATFRAWLAFALDHRSSTACRDMVDREEEGPPIEEWWKRDRRSLEDWRREIEVETLKYRR